MNFLYTLGANSRISYKRFYLNQEVDLSLDTVVYPSRDLSYSSSSSAYVILTPNKNSLLHVSSSLVDSFFITPDVDYPEDIRRPLVSFPARISSGACSNELYAIGGPSPYLYVFKWVDDSLETINTSGLGTVNSLAFSPDGTKLAVLHSTTPYLRLYNVEDWSYIDAKAIASRNGCIFSADGNSIITSHTTNPYLSIFDVTDLSRVHTVTSTANSPTGFYMGGNGLFVRNEENNDQIFFVTGNSTAQQIGVYTLSTRTAERFNYTGLSFEANKIAVDYLLRKIYVTHNVRLLSKSDRTTYITSFDLDTLQISEYQSDTLYSHVSDSSTVLCIIQKNTGKVSGTVRDITNSPAQREVTAYRRSDGLLCGKTLSDPVTGNYELLLPDDSPIDLQFKALDGELLNDIFYAAVQPELIP